MTDSNNLELLTVSQFSKKYPAIPEGGLRHQIFHSGSAQISSNSQIPGNGLQEVGAIMRIGRRVYLVPQRYFLWVELLNSGELSGVIKLMHEKKGEGVYLTPEDAVKEIRCPVEGQHRAKVVRHV